MRLTAGSVRGPTSGSRDLYSRLSCTLFIVSPPSSSALQTNINNQIRPMGCYTTMPATTSHEPAVYARFSRQPQSASSASEVVQEHQGSGVMSDSRSKREQEAHLM